MGSIAMHLPEKWAFLQFSADKVNSTAAITSPEWPVRHIAADLYYAQHAFAADNGGKFAQTIDQLLPYSADPVRC